LFLLVPVVEMYVLIRVGSWIGAWPTIGLVVLTAAIGVSLLRQQGLSTLSRGLRRMDAGELPAQEMLEGLFLAVGGALLLTPGFVTDAAGFACLLPPTRRGLVRLLVARGMVSVRGAGGDPFGRGPFGPGPSGQGPFGPGPSGPGPFGADPFRSGASGQGRPGPEVRRRRDGTHVIEGEYEREDDPRS
ncbi:MAG: FxsA family protein, partial [Pseudomonadales bacterium]|nr:FxsA family protein [Pseudomonadales bacterium]